MEAAFGFAPVFRPEHVAGETQSSRKKTRSWERIRPERSGLSARPTQDHVLLSGLKMLAP